MKKEVTKYKNTDKEFFPKINEEILIKLVFSLLIIVIVLFLVSHYDKGKNSNLTGKAIFSPTIPANCSNESARALWESVFKEEYSNINLTATTGQANKCNFLTAYKIKNNQELYYLYSQDTPMLFANSNIIQAFYINYTQNYFNNTIFNATDFILKNIQQIDSQALNFTTGIP